MTPVLPRQAVEPLDRRAAGAQHEERDIPKARADALDAPDKTRKRRPRLYSFFVGGKIEHVVTRMTEEEAKRFSVMPEERSLYVRLDSSKVNIAPPSYTATWFKLVSVQIGNDDTDYPKGDEVQTMVR
ncbi:hypothetical protein QA641_40075 [Bradyrhizobium sp. CB1650]|uniref:hypothetical protein n=1 Tax=Bradyrhizobium sp. CB1650 TaxID=3039153 RepID=UPI0024358DB8|nr:hypothetical protein [Bradyrhizobium sp. CB1650]WGD51566.1 hypothetical protein QA641_40075 [Bradyrhizobium sp. CB1650]